MEDDYVDFDSDFDENSYDRESFQLMHATGASANSDYSQDEKESENKRSKANNAASNYLDNSTEDSKRARHNSQERDRRRKLKDSYTNLVKVVPIFHDEKPSRAEVLRRTTKFINDIEQQNSRKQEQINKMSDNIAKLNAEIVFLEKLKAQRQPNHLFQPPVEQSVRKKTIKKKKSQGN